VNKRVYASPPAFTKCNPSLYATDDEDDASSVGTHKSGGGGGGGGGHGSSDDESEDGEGDHGHHAGMLTGERLSLTADDVAAGSWRRTSRGSHHSADDIFGEDLSAHAGKKFPTWGTGPGAGAGAGGGGRDSGRDSIELRRISVVEVPVPASPLSSPLKREKSAGLEAIKKLVDRQPDSLV
jgi:hypothetical protein